MSPDIDRGLAWLRNLASDEPEPWPQDIDDLATAVVEAFDRLRAIVEKLPLTADGVRVVPCLESVYLPEGRCSELILHISGAFIAFSSDAEFGYPVSECYSTLAALQAAKGGEK